MIQDKNIFKKGGSLIELLIVVAIMGFLAHSVFSAFGIARRAANVAEAFQTQRTMVRAIEQYVLDMGFYPPDVNRGWDPGFVRSLPWNPDAEAGEPPPGGYANPGTNCSHCPSDWEDRVADNWNGPYFVVWPRFTPWEGKFDYNYWGSGATRNGCTLDPGVYVGVQGDYNNENTIPLKDEQKMIDKGFDSEQCENGESQMLLQALE